MFPDEFHSRTTTARGYAMAELDQAKRFADKAAGMARDTVR
jgi:hypothetical protein